ncbi:MAG: hypothetical protein EBT13_06660 [Rhodobacteraceae bacterium]|nr:hypothetical protein [Paracoccaceae bacterium]
MLAQTANFSDASIWNQYGLPGLIIGFLLVAFVWFGRWVLTRTAEADAQQQDFLDRLLAQHREERLEWRRDSDARAEEHAGLLRELHERTLQACDRNTAACTALVQEIRQANFRAG